MNARYGSFQYGTVLVLLMTGCPPLKSSSRSVNAQGLVIMCSSIPQQSVS